MILYLAQIGSFVPAESFSFTPVDQIHVVCSSSEMSTGTVSRCGFVLSRVNIIFIQCFVSASHNEIFFAGR